MTALGAIWAAIRLVVQLALAAAMIIGAVWTAERLVATKPELGRQAASEPVYSIEIMELDLGSVQPRFEVFGSVEARRAVEMRSLASGEVVEVNPDLVAGGRVPKGAVLIRIDPFAYEGAVTESQANLAEAEAQMRENRARLDNERLALGRAGEQLEIAERDLKRAEDLARRGAGSRAVVDDKRLVVSQRGQAVELAENAIVTREAQISRLEASLERLRWRVAQARRELRDTTLVAPFDAVVRSENVEVGRRLGANDIVAALYAADALDLRFTVSDKQFGRLSDDAEGVVGRRVTAAWSIGDAPVRASAVVERVGAEVSAARGGVELIARVENPESGLKPGAVVTVEAPDRAYAQAAWAPESAVVNGDHVFIVERDAEGVDRLRRVGVEVLAWRGEAVVIRGTPPEALAGARLMVTRLAEAGDAVRVAAEPIRAAPAGVN